MQMFWGGIIRQSIDKTHNSGPGQIAVGAKSILLVFDITVIMPGHHGKSQDLAWSRLACSPCVFSHFMHFIFFSCPPLCSAKWVGGPLWTSHMKVYWEVQMYHPYRDLIPILLRVHPEHFMRLSVSHHSAEHESRAQTEDTRRGNILDPGHSRDRYLTWDQSGPFLSSDEWLRIFLHQSAWPVILPRPSDETEAFLPNKIGRRAETLVVGRTDIF